MWDTTPPDREERGDATAPQGDAHGPEEEYANPLEPRAMEEEGEETTTAEAPSDREDRGDATAPQGDAHGPKEEETDPHKPRAMVEEGEETATAEDAGDYPERMVLTLKPVEEAANELNWSTIKVEALQNDKGKDLKVEFSDRGGGA